MITLPTTIRADSNRPIGGLVNLISGTNVTLTQTGSSITISSTGGSITTPISLVNGGTGIPNTRTDSSITSNQNSLTFTTTVFNWNSTTGDLHIFGMTALADGTKVLINNDSSGHQIIITANAGSASSANRFFSPQGWDFTVYPGFSVELMYNGNRQKWEAVGGARRASTIYSGNLDVNDFINFNNKLNGDGNYGQVGFYTSNRYVNSSQLFNYDPSKQRLGVGTSSYGYNDSAGHFVANTGDTLSGLYTTSASLTSFSPINPPSSYAVYQATGHMYAPASLTSSQYVGHMMRPTSPSATQYPGVIYTVTSQSATQNQGHLYAPASPSAVESFSGTGYILGDFIDYRITAYSFNGSVNEYAPVNANTGAVTITSALSDTDISWSAPTSGSASITGYVVERNYNGAGWLDAIDVGSSTSLHDDNTGWGSISLTPVFPDYIATGLTYDYQIFQGIDDGIGGYTWGITSAIASMTDDNSGNPFVNQISFMNNTGGTGTITQYRVYRQINGGGFNDYLDTNSTYFTDNNTGWTSGGLPPTPQLDEYVANNTIRDYIIYQGAGDGMGGYIWSASGTTTTMTDDNTGNTYYVNVGYTADNSGIDGSPVQFRIYRQVNGGGYNEYCDNGTSTMFYDSPSVGWTSGGLPPTPQFADYVANGTQIQYRVYQGGDDGSGGYIWSAVSSDTSTTDDSSGNPYTNSISWTVNGTGTVTPTRVRVYRNIAGAGFNDYQEMASSTNSLLDDNTGWTTGTAPTPNYPDFTANGSSRHYESYDTGYAPDGTTVLFSQSHTDFTFNDDNSGNPYVLNHAISSLAYPFTVTLVNTDLSIGVVVPTGDTNLTEDSTESGWTTPTLTPNTYGLIANGSNWTRTYDFYNYSSTLGVYSTSSGLGVTTDPNDGLYYYVTITFSGQTTYAKILRDTGGGYTNSQNAPTSPIIDDGSTLFASTDVTVTPTTRYPIAVIGESHGTDTTTNAAFVARSIDGDYSRLEFQDNTKTVTSSIESDASGMRINNVNFATFIPRDPTGVPNNSFFVDSTNSNTASFKNSSGVVYALY